MDITKRKMIQNKPIIYDSLTKTSRITFNSNQDELSNGKGAFGSRGNGVV